VSRDFAMMDLDEAKRILAAFEREKVEYVLVGSMAMAAQGLVRATRDLDFFVSPEPDNVARLKRALKSSTTATPAWTRSRGTRRRLPGARVRSAARSLLDRHPDA
jgi:hypothetical protein